MEDEGLRAAVEIFNGILLNINLIYQSLVVKNILYICVEQGAEERFRRNNSSSSQIYIENCE